MIYFVDEMRVGFIYTFGVTDNNEKQSFFTTTPSSVRP